MWRRGTESSKKHLTAQCQRVKGDAYLWRVIDQFTLIGFGCASGREREKGILNMAGKSLHLCVFVIYAIQTNTGFNIDVQFPVIKEGKTKGSLFGFSVALHKQTEKTTKNL